MRKQKWSCSELTTAYKKHILRASGLSPSTSFRYGRFIEEFLRAKYGGEACDLADLRPADLINFVTELSFRYKPKTCKYAATALRSLLRFVQFEGFCNAGLVRAVPTIPSWKHAGLPATLTDEQLAKLLASFDRSTASGLRDYAMLRCLAGLGLRADEVARISLDDINWRTGILRIPTTKARRGTILPLPDAVGRALATYLKSGRPPTQERRIFVRHRRPKPGVPVSSEVVKAVVYRAFQRTGIDAPSRGSHILRHTVATRMVRRGATLKDIADVLGHRSLDTTAIYAKVDLPRLREVAMPWPEVRS